MKGRKGSEVEHTFSALASHESSWIVSSLQRQEGVMVAAECVPWP